MADLANMEDQGGPLGGRTMTGLLMRSANVGMPVRVWYVGLSSVRSRYWCFTCVPVEL